MDTLILYLRRVHAYDYFTASQHENERMLAVKTAVASLRIQTNEDDPEGVYEKVRERNEERLTKGSPFPDYMAMLREEVERYIRDMERLGRDEQKEVWKCCGCEKKFKTSDFLAKHMIAKHEDIKFKVLPQSVRTSRPSCASFT